MLSIRQKITRKLVERSIQKLTAQLPENTLKNGMIRTNDVQFTVPGTRNLAILRIESELYEVNFRVYAVRKGTNRACSNFIHSCSCTEIESYLKNEVDCDEVLRSVMHLSEKC